MKKYLITLFAAVSFLACTRELPAPETSGALTQITITASLEDASKQSLTGFKVAWEEGDQIMVCFDQYSNQFVFTLNPEDAGKTTGRFTGEISAYVMNYYGPLHAVYPASAVGDRYYPDYLTVNIPSTQQYREGSFGKDANICICTTSDIGSTLSFKNTGGLLKLTLTGSEVVSSIELTSDADALAGLCYILKTADSTGDNYYYTSFNNTLTLDCQDGVQLDDIGKDFYFFLPYGTLSGGFSLKITDTDGGVMIKKAPASESNKIQRSKILSMPSFKFEKSKYYVFTNRIVPGEYSNPADGGTLVKSFVSGAGQCGIDSGTAFNLRNWDEGSCADYSLPADVQLVDKRRGLAWYVSQDGTMGYVITAL